MKKTAIILLTILFSIYVGINSVDFILTDATLMIQLIFTVLGLSFTSYTFIFSPLSKIYKKYNENNIKNKLVKLLFEIESNLKSLLLFSVIIVICHFILNHDIPLIVEPGIIDFGLFKIFALKNMIFYTIICFSSIFSLLTFYDIMSASFTILRGTLENGIDV